MTIAIQTDEDIKRSVVDELYWDDRVDAADVRVEVHDGRVTLSGTVPTYAARIAAEEDARAIVGGGTVSNELTVQYPVAELPSTGELEANVLAALQWDSEVDPSDIEVRADAGWITLRGTVESYWQKARAEDLTLHMSGVRGVSNELAVVPSRKFDDRRIGEEIVRALERNVYVDADQVDVKVSDGVVTLTGTVPDRRAYRAARDAARYTRGVTDIINQLTVE